MLGGEGQERSRPETAEETHLALGQAQLHAAWVKQHFATFFLPWLDFLDQVVQVCPVPWNNWVPNSEREEARKLHRQQ